MFDMGDSMKLVRFELAFEDRPMGIGFIAGLDDVGFPEEMERELLDNLNANLSIPNYDVFHVPNGYRPVAYFTPEGLRCFEADVDNISRYIKELDCGWSVIRKEIACPEDDELILYSDQHQVIVGEPWQRLPIDFFNILWYNILYKKKGLYASS